MEAKTHQKKAWATKKNRLAARDEKHCFHDFMVWGAPGMHKNN